MLFLRALLWGHIQYLGLHGSKNSNSHISCNKLSEGLQSTYQGVMGNPNRMLTPQVKASSQVPQITLGSLLARPSVVHAAKVKTAVLLYLVQNMHLYTLWDMTSLQCSLFHSNINLAGNYVIRGLRQKLDWCDPLDEAFLHFLGSWTVMVTKNRMGAWGYIQPTQKPQQD